MSVVTGRNRGVLRMGLLMIRVCSQKGCTSHLGGGASMSDWAVVDGPITSLLFRLDLFTNWCWGLKVLCSWVKVSPMGMAHMAARLIACAARECFEGKFCAVEEVALAVATKDSGRRQCQDRPCVDAAL
eukprot:3286328-Amphidinium_carterae.1